MSDHTNDGGQESPAEAASRDSEWSNFAPSLPESIAESRSLLSTIAKVGDRLGDFQILDTLGEGAFGKVFLARQISLDRVVALKITADLGQEGRTMARLEHTNIVQVFSETLDPERRIRLLCMQYVPGATLQSILQIFRSKPRRDRHGKLMLEIVDQTASKPSYFDPASLRFRQTLAVCQLDEAVCWVGQQIAEALAYAHSREVLHRDIKPANVLLNQYGKPLLSDFSLSFPTTGQVGIEAAIFGGTLGYMAPEHVHALDPDYPIGPEAVTETSDIYSLGAVLFDLLVGVKRANHLDPVWPTSAEQLETEKSRLTTMLLDQRVPHVLARIIIRCMEPEKTRRFQSAQELAESLAGCYSLLRAERALPHAGPLARLARGYPLSFILATTVIPNLTASAANMVYISLFVIKNLTTSQQAAFGQMALWYNVAVLAVMLVMLNRTLFAAARRWYRLRGDPVNSFVDVDDARRRTLHLSIWVIILGAAGWLPFAVIIPGGMEILAGPIDRGVLLHLSLTFTVTGLIAVVANYYVTAYVVLRCLYTWLWEHVTDYSDTAAKELSNVKRMNLIGQIVSGLTPLGAATLLVIVGPEQFTTDALQRFQGVLVVLIGMGIAGFWLAMTASTLLNEVVNTLTSTGRRPQSEQV